MALRGMQFDPAGRQLQPRFLAAMRIREMPDASRILRLHRGPPAGKQRTADLTNAPIAPAGCTIFPPVKDDPQMKFVPAVLGKELLKGPFRVRDIFPARQLPALGETVDVGVHREGRYPKGL